MCCVFESGVLTERAERRRRLLAGASDGLRVQGLLDKLGMEAFDLAFTAAKHADRNACLSIMITGSKRTRLNKRRVGSLFSH